MCDVVLDSVGETKDAQTLTHLGKMCETTNPYHRVEVSRYDELNKTEKNLLITAAGEFIAFETDATEIWLQAEYGRLSFNRAMPETAGAGFNLYMEKDGELVPIAGNGDNSSVNNPDGTAGDTSTAYVGQICGVYAAKDGSIWFTDVRHQTVRKLTPDASGDYAKGKIETIAKGFYPSDLYVTDDCMKVYVTSATTHTVRLIEIF